ncbi:MAG TPA: cation-transporting P-type ATPase [Chitinophagaceae bacterium]|nr:cation-transporting P-type ATPase [Chitinophagaceae bacterium]
MNWHLLDINQVFIATKSSATGLSDSEAHQRIQAYGANEIKSAKKDPPGFYLFNSLRIL